MCLKLNWIERQIANLKVESSNLSKHENGAERPLPRPHDFVERKRGTGK